MNIWFCMAAVWGIAWVATMALCVLLHAPEYVIAGIGFGGGAYPLIWIGAGIIFKEDPSA